MTQLKEVLKQHAAESIDAAFEAGYDEAAEVSYTTGYEDGREQGAREALDLIESTRSAFGFADDDAGDACDCPICRLEDEDDGVRLLTGDPASDARVLADVHNDLAQQVDDLLYTLDMWAPTVDDRIQALASALDRALGLTEELAQAGLALAKQVNELQTAVELSEADAVVLESLQDRVADLESFTGLTELADSAGAVI